MKLIDKDAVVSWVTEKREAALYRQHNLEKIGQETVLNEMIAFELNKIISFLNTLEAKEVDLEKEYKDFVEEDPVYNKLVNGIVGKAIAKHFFKLGLRSTITEEDYKLIWNIGDEIPNMPEEEFFKELLKRYKTQKGK